ncbi:MAG: extracellular solute-binding protein [Alphaproteobacteria bacterium]
MGRIRLLAAFVGVAFFSTVAGPVSAAGTDGPRHAMAMHGKPKYPADFKHFDYVNPNATKGGEEVIGAVGTFDSLNPFILKGTPAGIFSIYDSLMVASADEAFTEYCLLCETIEVPDDRSWVEFTLRDDAYWHDGQPITVDDVIFSFNILVEQGRPFYRFYYGDVVDVSKTGERKVKFTFRNDQNQELPLIMGQLTVLPKHYWEERDFSKTTLEPPLGSGPYRVADVEPGRTIVFERVSDYWGTNHPARVGFSNIDVIRQEYFRDRTVAREAFKGGDLDLWFENTSKDWATAFDTPAVRAGLIIREEIPHQRTAGMQGFGFNTRKELFADRRVREALSHAFDFEWTNENLFYDAYTRTASYFDNSELGSRGLLKDAGAEERKTLERYRGRIPEEVFTEQFTVPATDGSGARGVRANLRQARTLLEEAGWEIRDGTLVNVDGGQPFEFEILIRSPAFERIILPFARNLERLGIETNVRLVDASQYQARLESFDFDMTVVVFGQSDSPGNEQRSFWGSEAAEERGGRNLIGVSDPVIDELVELVITAPSRESLVERTRALDRVLLWGHYVVPNWHIPHDRIAYWDKYGKPGVVPKNGVQISAWWIDPQKESDLEERRIALKK